MFHASLCSVDRSLSEANIFCPVRGCKRTTMSICTSPHPGLLLPSFKEGIGSHDDTTAIMARAHTASLAAEEALEREAAIWARQDTDTMGERARAARTEIEHMLQQQNGITKCLQSYTENRTEEHFERMMNMWGDWVHGHMTTMRAYEELYPASAVDDARRPLECRDDTLGV
jgi:hypothetical protein